MFSKHLVGGHQVESQSFFDYLPSLKRAKCPIYNLQTILGYWFQI